MRNGGKLLILLGFGSDWWFFRSFQYKVVVYTDGEISDNPSQSTKAIYGKINGKNTASLLTINSNYSNGDTFKVKVYEDDKLVGESDEKVLSGDTLEFSNINI